MSESKRTYRRGQYRTLADVAQNGLFNDHDIQIPLEGCEIKGKDSLDGETKIVMDIKVDTSLVGSVIHQKDSLSDTVATLFWLYCWFSVVFLECRHLNWVTQAGRETYSSESPTNKEEV